jgi:L-alanine-DL-glutamate epimerase-like enolase superfamily enzyme
MDIVDGKALAPSEPGIGIEWDWEAVKARSIGEFTREIHG